MQQSFDVSRRDALVRACQGRASSLEVFSEVLVSLEEFFYGNSDFGTIGCNLTPHPGLQEFTSVLRAIRGRADVQDVLVAITDLCEDARDSWPFSDRVYILTSAAGEDVNSWVARLLPDEVVPAELSELSIKLPDLRTGYMPYRVWWD